MRAEKAADMAVREAVVAREAAEVEQLRLVKGAATARQRWHDERDRSRQPARAADLAARGQFLERLAEAARARQLEAAGHRDGALRAATNAETAARSAQRDARRDREALDKHKAREDAAADREADRRAEVALDDLTSSRRGRR